ncbi:tyrosine-type recombinase/integrase [Streptantibioticus silvisoli]|uniref:Tyrosine-type recombinase/integrase n=1 Tax=Streptantibioticus silvisoli TaxID=2705255 RepID=A0ABT6VYL1_9ACTN|nr:tyrosine-type recombinase/integrase [Streptantibioticus silvisoli]MDI5962568.1 tyrosine-type recombinase/integrase [Streptantibioticus silvisoli]
MTANSLLPLYTERPDRESRDRLEILTALIGAPSFDPIFRAEIVRIPRNHPVFSWGCVVRDCERGRSGGSRLCKVHGLEWAGSRAAGRGMAAFLENAQPLEAVGWQEEAVCRLCPERPASHITLQLCARHHVNWKFYRAQSAGEADIAEWLADGVSYPGFGRCSVLVCPSLAASGNGLCSGHATRYEKDRRPAGVEVSKNGSHGDKLHGSLAPVNCTDEAAFRDWCVSAKPILWPGQINLRGLRPLLRAEIQYSLFAHTQRDRPGLWGLSWLQKLANLCREQEANSLVDLDLEDAPRFCGGIVRTMLHLLRQVYFTPDDAKEAGFLEIDHFGVRLHHRASHVDLTAVPQRWLRDLLWDHIADLLRSPVSPRSAMPIDTVRRGITELGVFLEIDAPGGGHDPRVLTVDHMRRFIADQRQRENEKLPSLAMKGRDGKPSTVTSVTRSVVFNTVRKVLREAMETGRAEQIHLQREFITEMPAAGGVTIRARRPFPDEVARALADEVNLNRFAEDYDPEDQGVRDIWEAIVITGRRSGEVLNLRWDCIGRYGGLPMFWHDQTKVGNYDVAIRIPERLYNLIVARQSKTMDRYFARFGRRPTGAERANMALFPSKVRNPDGTISISYQWFHSRFKPWTDDLDLGRLVPHQARHTLATSLLRHGATLTHIRRYLGQVSDRMAEHYVHLTSDDLENVLQHVWVTGPGTAQPGELLAGETAPLTRERAQALAIDLARRSTPAEGGFCTFQPVVDGGACPWNLDCHNCDKFVLSGADLLYWRRKREQWRLLAEGAPDDATADYLHRHFEPTARAIDGLEKALAGLGLLDDALALDLRKPQDYFHRIWSTAFRAADLADVGDDEQSEYSDTCTTDIDPEQDIA